ncbi:GNAT family N-acetyltransferase, partial [Streptomyces sp. NPDC059556]|uniref:GNAT family N-acetyltransferase n=1 Tax=Streptomyces sp. NPDC059556 TaxID=3346863 RepID=UPI00368FCD01
LCVCGGCGGVCLSGCCASPLAPPPRVCFSPPPPPGLDRVVAITHISNQASENVIGKLGMTEERETTHPAFGVPLRVYAIDLTEYEA